jgi:hypothetical protein
LTLLCIVCVLKKRNKGIGPKIFLRDCNYVPLALHWVSLNLRQTLVTNQRQSNNSLSRQTLVTPQSCVYSLMKCSLAFTKRYSHFKGFAFFTFLSPWWSRNTFAKTIHLLGVLFWVTEQDLSHRPVILVALDFVNTCKIFFYFSYLGNIPSVLTVSTLAMHEILIFVCWQKCLNEIL